MNQRPSGYEPDELPGCSIPRHCFVSWYRDKKTARTGVDADFVTPEGEVVLIEGFVFPADFACTILLCGPGSDLLSHVLRRSTIGAGGLNGRVRDGIGWGTPAITTRSAKKNAERIY